MDLKTLVASILAERVTADVATVYALVLVAREELKLDVEVTPLAVEKTIRELVDEGCAAEYIETSMDLSRRFRKYIITDKIKTLAKPLPAKTRRVADMRYVTPTFYALLNYTALPP
ncbi:MAG: hypothetical protein ACK4M3_05125 [Pyrobaculum sp.]